MKKRYTVLIVDDDKFLLEMYQKKFLRYDIHAEICVGPDEALSKLRGGLKPDILVFDIIMPKMDGLELLTEIRKEKLAAEAVMIMLTNESGAEKVAQAKSLGAAGYIVKATSVPSEVVEEIINIADAHTT